MIRLIFALVLVLFLPGFFLTLIFFKKLDLIKLILFSFSFSIIIDVLLAFFLGGTKFLKNMTGGYTSLNIFGSLLFISTLLAVVYFLSRGKNVKRK